MLPFGWESKLSVRAASEDRLVRLIERAARIFGPVAAADERRRGPPLVVFAQIEDVRDVQVPQAGDVYGGPGVPAGEEDVVECVESEGGRAGRA